MPAAVDALARAGCAPISRTRSHPPNDEARPLGTRWVERPMAQTIHDWLRKDVDSDLATHLPVSLSTSKHPRQRFRRRILPELTAEDLIGLGVHLDRPPPQALMAIRPCAAMGLLARARQFSYNRRPCCLRNRREPGPIAHLTLCSRPGRLDGTRGPASNPEGHEQASAGLP